VTVTKEVLDQMGGSIEVETEKGEGSRFTVQLPRTEDSSEA
jgi:Histidine kinase-, DNA gyrase B-, and HSP90-like ATPase.